jgi:mono/diheme cytochrome c family protein
MAPNSPRNLKLRKILFASLLVLICFSIGLAIQHQKKEWRVPEDAKNLKNPLQPSESNFTAAKLLYRDKCSDCHGDTGKGDGPQATMHDIAPANLTDANRMSRITDGEIFYQISEGREPMPAFKKRLTPDQRWQLVLFVRSFSAPDKKPIPALENTLPKN